MGNSTDHKIFSILYKPGMTNKKLLGCETIPRLLENQFFALEVSIDICTSTFRDMLKS